MSFSKIIKDRRLKLGIGVRELCRMTDAPVVPSPIKSPIYISRIEAGDSFEMPITSVTIDKLWGIGHVLRINPFDLFLRSRNRDDLLPLVESFGLRDCEPQPFGAFVRERRKALDLSIRAAADNSVDWYISSGYWSQMETDFRGCISKISGEKLWGIGVALDVDPCLLYVLSRGMDERYLNHESRDRLFS